MIDVNYQRIILELAVTWLLFGVLFACALALIGVLFGLLRPDSGTRNYLFGIFGASTLGILTAASGNFLRADPQSAAEDIQRKAERSAYEDISRTNVEKSGTKIITVYTQIGSNADMAKYTSLSNTLKGTRFLVPGVENVKTTISQNQILYCNPDNESDAKDLKQALESKGFNSFSLMVIAKCDKVKNRNIVEVWLQSGT